jgi:hypothetical protein
VGSLNGVVPTNLLDNPFPNGFISPSGTSLGMLTNVGQSISAPTRYRPSPYMEQWLLGVQYQLLSTTTLQVNYVGNRGVKLPWNGFQANQLNPADLALGNGLLEQVANPFYGTITSGSLSYPTVARGQLLLPYPQFTSVLLSQQPGAFSNYNALNASLTRNFRNGLQFLASFTWSKYLTNEDDVINFFGAAEPRNWYNTSLDKSTASNDVPRSFVLSWVYDLPVGKGRKFAPHNAIVDGLVGGWSLSGVGTFKDGFPLAFTTTNNTNSFGGNQYPNIVADPSLPNPTPQRWFNTAAFTQPAAFTFGNVSRTTPYLRSEGTENFDMNLNKNWQLWNETSRLQFRAEAYNLLNRTAFFAPNTNLASSAFGTVTSAGSARSIQLALKLYW